MNEQKINTWKICINDICYGGYTNYSIEEEIRKFLDLTTEEREKLPDIT